MFILSSIYKIVWIPIIQIEQPLTKNRATKKSKNGACSDTCKNGRMHLWVRDWSRNSTPSIGQPYVLIKH
jgi:hypothetical protein